MAVPVRKVAVGVFKDRLRAQSAVNDLVKAGFREEQIGVVYKDADAATRPADEGTAAATGAVTGMVAGAGVGGLWAIGIAAGLLPAIGPVVAGGLLASLAASAATGAAAGGLIGALIGMGIPEEEAREYETAFHAGSTIVTVRANGRYDEAVSILTRAGAEVQASVTRDLHAEKSRAFATSEPMPHSTAGTCSTSGSAAPMARAGEGATVKLHEEHIEARKEPVQTGEVKIHKEVITEHKTLDVPVTREEVVIERHPVSGTCSTSELKSDEIRIPVKEEQVHVEKHAEVKEEVKVGKRKVQETKKVGADVRREEVRIEKDGDPRVRGTGQKQPNR